MIALPIGAHTPIGVLQGYKMKFKKSMLKMFWYWINERHAIYIRRKAGKEFPWTKDKILQKYKFTNVYRQLDATTQQWTKRYVDILGRGKKLSDGEVLFQCMLFRLFNLPDTYDALYYGMDSWSIKKAMKILETRQAEGKKIFTGAYIIPNVGRSDPKIQVICEALQQAWEARDDMAQEIKDSHSIEKTVKILRKVNTVGGFIAYEIACDLRFTKLLWPCNDVYSWANPGPGAMRGIHRLMKGSAEWAGSKPDYVKAMRKLYVLATVAGSPLSFLTDRGIWRGEEPFEMREIEHSLCEFDKYMRVKNGEGRPRSKFVPPEERK